MTIGRASQLFLHFRRYTDLSLCSRMSSNLCSINCALSKNWCNTETRIDEVTIDWFISNFHFHEAKGIDLRSSIFSSNTNDKFKWYLLCKPNGKTEKKDTVSLFLNLSTELVENLFAQITFSTLDLTGVTKNIKRLGVREFNSKSTGWGSLSFLEKNQSFKDTLISNQNKLMIRCNVRFSEMKNVDSIFHRCPLKMPASNISNNPALQLETLKFSDSDVIISVNGKDFSSHKSILAARSPVFAAMFRNNTTEAELNRVVIEDVNEEVMAEMLRYIYFETCQNLEKFAEELLVAADKYALDDLKIICLKELGKTLSVENAVKILVLADKHSAKDLKVEAIKFIVSKSAEIVKTSAWKDILLSNPQLVSEVCEALTRRLL